jgi:hypothetical protein
MEPIIKELLPNRVEKKVKHGDKVIKIEVHFWTDKMASDKEKLVPKAAWDSGTVHILKNAGHGIKRSKSFPFSSLSELQPTIEKAFKETGISLVHSSKYWSVYYP